MVEIPVFDGRGYPTHLRGITSCPGLYFLGLPWQHTWGSGRLCGVGADAGYLARQIAAFGARQEVRWIAGTTASTYPSDDDWIRAENGGMTMRQAGNAVSDAHRHLA